ncbi:LOW QUALITY PROTEIN: hypothetical protein QYF61_010256 [Mycteria americana]|uniref:Uncharacterized protein n=1 Tax=Mycteria americana TaxID=33587 RepID=A0AAN7N5E6_MYCAM|nr:LOW QUALITY PROTEIN: hypothetical protein QYF61_010256 [Mycteria americana]
MQYSSWGLTRAEEQNYLPQPAGLASFDAAEDTVGFLDCERTVLAHYPQALPTRAALNSFIPQPVLIPGVALTQVPLNGIPSLRHVNCTTQLGVICKSAEGALNPTVYVIDEGTAHLQHQYCIQLWSPQHRKDMDLLEQVQRRATKTIRGMEHLSYEERLRVVVVQPGEEKALGRPYCSLSVLKGGLQERGGQNFLACCDRTRENAFKLKEGRIRLDVRKKFFTIRVVKHWNRLPGQVADAPSLEAFKVRLDRALSNVRLLRAPSNLSLNVSRDGASITSLGNLFQCFTILIVKNFFLISSLNLPLFSLKPFPLVLLLFNRA